jgi:uncharacterized OB-fold protein
VDPATPVVRDEASAPFFDAAAEGRLLIRRCAACGHWIAPYQRMGASLDRCPACTSDRLEWAAAAGTGILVTWTVVHGRTGGAERTVGVVELAEGPWLTAPLDADPAGLVAGTEMAVGFERPGGGEPVPVFRLASAG